MPQGSKSRIIAAALFIVGVAWLLLHTTQDDTNRLFFGAWRTRHLATATVVFYAGLLILLSSASKRALFAAIFATILVTITFGLIELVGLFGIISYPKVFGRAHSGSWHDRVAPNLDVRGRAYQDLANTARSPSEPIEFHYVTDRRGFRNANDRDEADIYLVGDSILVAGLLPFENTLTALLERDLRLRVMNVAVTGLAVQEERDLFKAAKLPLQNHLVLHFVFEGNDLHDSARYRNGPPMNQDPAFKRTFTFNFLNWLIDKTDRRTFDRDVRFGVIRGTNYLFLLDYSFPGMEDEFKYICGALLDMRDAVMSSKGTYAIVFMPEKIRVLGPSCEFPTTSSIRDYQSQLSPLRNWIALWCAKHGIPMLDLTDALTESTQSGAVPWFPADTHPDDVGHRVAANTIENWNVVTSWIRSRTQSQPDSRSEH